MRQTVRRLALQCVACLAAEMRDDPVHVCTAMLVCALWTLSLVNCYFEKLLASI